MRNQRNGRRSQRGAVGVLDRVRLRRDLADHEEQHDLEHDADARRPARRAVRSSRTPSRVGARELGDEHEQQHDVERPLRVLEHRGQPSPRRLRPSSASASARIRLMRTNAVSAMREPDRREEQHDDDGEDRPVGCRSRLGSRRRRARARAARKRSSSSRSRRCIALGVVAARRGRSSKQVQHAVHDEQRELVVERDAACSRAWRCATVGADHDVAEHDRRVVGSLGGAGPRPPSSGWRPPGVLVVDREREHVGRAVAAEEAAG